jgi:hypothetical protein
MSYKTITLMHSSASLHGRLTAAAAKEEIAAPEQWVQGQMWFLAASPGWETAWENALKQGDNTKFNPDTGARDDVITDQMILAAVQARRARLASLDTPEPPPQP